MKNKIRVHWTEIAFALSAIGALTLPARAMDLLAVLTVIPTVEVLRKMWTPDIEEMQKRAFGWHASDLFGIYGSNEWISTQDGSFFRPSEEFPPAPGFNYRGLLSVAATCPNTEIQAVSPGDTLDIFGNTLLVGGTRVTPMLASFLDAQESIPFKFVPEAKVSEHFRPPTPPEKIFRHFANEGHIYTKTSVTGKYLIDTRNPDIPPYGPFIDKNGSITGDVLVLTIGRDVSANRIVVANAGYGAADRLSDTLCRGEHLERICGAIPKVGPARMQAVFTVPVEHKQEGEEYGQPELKDIVKY